MQVRQVTITPDVAVAMLKGNTKNRPLRMSHVKHLARLMSEGKWLENGDTICVNGTVLIDGQHRLEAIKMSGVSLKCIVVSDLSSQAFTTKDTGSRRGAGDMFYVAGRTDVNNLASATLYVHNYLKYGTMSKSTANAKKLSPAEVLAFESKHQGIRNAMHGVSNKSRLAPYALLAAMFYLFSQKDMDAAATFMKGLTTGDGIKRGDPVYFLRERLIRNATSTAKLNTLTIAAFIVKAWNATRTATPLAAFKYTSSKEYSEKFPQIV